MHDASLDGAKAAWRRRLIAGRRRDPRVIAAARRRIGRHVHTLLTAVSGAPPAVALYLPLPSEPLPEDLAATLLRAGMRVLAPVSVPGRPLDWCELDAAAPLESQLAPSGVGVAEPVGARLGAQAVRGVDVLLVPALAVDRSGTRLGRGGGFYDRTLALLGDHVMGASPPQVAAVVYDDEVVPELPRDPHDQRVPAAVTPSGIVTLGV